MASASNRRPIEQLYTEARIQTLLLARIANLLSLIAGPAAYTEPNGWTPEDLTAEIDAWRTDPSLLPI